jgi:hypothetical protein
VFAPPVGPRRGAPARRPPVTPPKTPSACRRTTWSRPVSAPAALRASATARCFPIGRGRHALAPPGRRGRPRHRGRRQDRAEGPGQGAGGAAFEACRDVSHLLRPGHLRQLAISSMTRRRARTTASSRSTC